MSAEVKKQVELEIAHVLFIDIVDYSKLSINEQRAAVDDLTQIVRASEQFQKLETSERLIKIPTGDGMALVFYSSPEAPVRCAMELGRALKGHGRLGVRMGIQGARQSHRGTHQVRLTRDLKIVIHLAIALLPTGRVQCLVVSS
jgi:hypothetical protein